MTRNSLSFERRHRIDFFRGFFRPPLLTPLFFPTTDFLQAGRYCNDTATGNTDRNRSVIADLDIFRSITYLLRWPRSQDFQREGNNLILYLNTTCGGGGRGVETS